jgi:hypothetical protein
VPQKGRYLLAALPVRQVDRWHPAWRSRTPTCLSQNETWEQAELLARKYEQAAIGGADIKAARTLPTVKEAVDGYLRDAEAPGLAVSTIQKLRQIFEKQLLDFAEEHSFTFLRDLNSPT